VGTGRVVSDFYLGLLFGAIFAVGASGLVMLALGRRSQRRGLIILIISTATGCLAVCVFLQPHPPQIDSSWKELFSQDAEPTDRRATAYTDTGRPIGLVANGEGDFPSEESRAQEAHLGQKFPLTLIRTAKPDPGSNCFGWVFTGGRYWINGIDVDKIMADNSYQRVYDPQPGDVIIYRGYVGEVIHAAVVRVAGEPVFVEGKWNCLGVYLHAAQEYPFAPNYDYYRSERNGHLLKLPSE
jgi:hypothetical protein